MHFNFLTISGLRTALCGLLLLTAGDQHARAAGPDETATVAVEALDRLVAKMVSDEDIIGGELHILHQGETLLHKAYGWKDREADLPLEIDAVYCVRSMTKPLIGTAIRMLIEEGRLSEDTLVSTLLSEFASGPQAEITIGHLLSHSSGLPMTALNRPLGQYQGLMEVAEQAARTTLDFSPGSTFQYSDAGSDVLGAVVMAVTGQKVEVFVQERLIRPLSMHDTSTLLSQRDALYRQRIPTAYSGGSGNWQPHWSSRNEDLFPFFLTSQGLYSTTSDYARFMALWMNKGQVEDRQLLSPDSIEIALTPKYGLDQYPEVGPTLKTHYAQQWMVLADHKDPDSPTVEMFGHDGSDGTHAWAWPEKQLLVLFFTQSRGTTAGLRLQRSVQNLLIDGHQQGLIPVQPSEADLADLAGLYWDETAAGAYYVITPHAQGLHLERPGRMTMIFKPTETPDRFEYADQPAIWIAFDRDESGQVEAMRTFFGNAVETDPRHYPEDQLPDLGAIIASVQQAHRMDLLPESGVLEMTGEWSIPKRQISAQSRVWMGATRMRMNLNIAGVTESVLVNGSSAWKVDSMRGLVSLEGVELEQTLLDQWPVLVGDWRKHYDHVEVLKTLKVNERQLVLIRVVPSLGHGATLYVDQESGQLLRTDRVVQLPGVGLVGVQTRYQDYRQVNGLLLPFETVARFAHPLIGEIKTVLASATVVETVDQTLFDPDTLD